MTTLNKDDATMELGEKVVKTKLIAKAVLTGGILETGSAATT